MRGDVSAHQHLEPLLVDWDRRPLGFDDFPRPPLTLATFNDLLGERGVDREEDFPEPCSVRSPASVRHPLIGHPLCHAGVLDRKRPNLRNRQLRPYRHPGLTDAAQKDRGLLFREELLEIGPCDEPYVGQEVTL